MALNIALASARPPLLEDLLNSCGATLTSLGIEGLASFAQASARQPDAIVVEHDERAPIPPALLQIRRQHPTTGILLVLPRLDPALMLEAMRSGVNECLAEPITETELRAALERIAYKPQTSTRGDVFAVVGAKGGVGATTVAVNLATMLAKIKPSGALLIDMFLTYGDAGVFLGADSRFSIADALENLHRMDSAFLRTLITTTRSGVSLIASSERQLGFPVEAAQLRGLINLAADEFPYVVLDIPRADTAALDALDRANTIVIVANQELATVRSAGRMAASLGQRYGKERVSVVITRYDERAEIGQQDVERVVGRPVAHILPNNYPITVASLNKGRPLVLDNHTKLAGAFTTLAHSLAKLTPTKPEKEKSGGLFSRIAGRR